MSYATSFRVKQPNILLTDYQLAHRISKDIFPEGPV
jgi:hypothetical protein